MAALTMVQSGIMAPRLGILWTNAADSIRVQDRDLFKIANECLNLFLSLLLSGSIQAARFLDVPVCSNVSSNIQMSALPHPSRALQGHVTIG